MPKCLLIVSDLHCGSIYGLLPPGFTTSDGRMVSPNAGQAYLWSCWSSLAEHAAKLKIAGVIVNGDVVDGRQQAQRGTELCLPMIEDQAAAAEACLKFLRKHTGSAKWYFTQGCVTPGHKVLTADLRWVPVESLAVGDRLIAPEEHASRGGRDWTIAEVTAVVPITKDACEITLEDGSTLTATCDHPWLVDNGGALGWRKTKRLGKNARLPLLLPVWDGGDSYVHGWLSGFFDGEGTLKQARPRGSYGKRSLLEAGQNEGAALSRADAYLRSAGFTFSVYSNNRDRLRTIHILGGLPEVLRFLGTVRPVRLLQKFNPWELGTIKARKYVGIRGVRYLGKREVVGLSTSTGTYLVNGFGSHNTEYHDAKAGREVEVVARALDARPYTGAGTGRYCREVLDLEVDGVVCNFSHGISVSGGLYRATSPDREGVWSALAGKEGKVPKADLVVRSHAHYFVHVEHESKHILITPCWQLQTRFMRRNSAYRMLPSIGAVLLWIDGGAKKRGDDPVRVQKILYPLPPIKTTVLRRAP